MNLLMWIGMEMNYCFDVLGTESDMIYKKIEGDVENTCSGKLCTNLTPGETIIKLRFGLEDGLKRRKKRWPILWESHSLISPV